MSEWLASLSGRRQCQALLLQIVTFSFFRRLGAQHHCPHCPSLLTPAHLLLYCPVFTPFHPRTGDAGGALLGAYRSDKDALPRFIELAQDELLRAKDLLCLSAGPDVPPELRGPRLRQGQEAEPAPSREATGGEGPLTGNFVHTPRQAQC